MKLLITTHAILRYMERIKGVEIPNGESTLEIYNECLLNDIITEQDIEDIKKDVLNDYVKDKVEVLGDGSYPLSKKSHVVAIIKNGRVITVYDKEKSNKE